MVDEVSARLLPPEPQFLVNVGSSLHVDQKTRAELRCSLGNVKNREDIVLLVGLVRILYIQSSDGGSSHTRIGRHGCILQVDPFLFKYGQRFVKQCTQGRTVDK